MWGRAPCYDPGGSRALPCWKRGCTTAESEAKCCDPWTWFEPLTASHPGKQSFTARACLQHGAFPGLLKSPTEAAPVLLAARDSRASGTGGAGRFCCSELTQAEKSPRGDCSQSHHTWRRAKLENLENGEGQSTALRHNAHAAGSAGSRSRLQPATCLLLRLPDTRGSATGRGTRSCKGWRSCSHGERGRISKIPARCGTPRGSS